jgi:hypothetical protein
MVHHPNRAIVAPGRRLRWRLRLTHLLHDTTEIVAVPTGGYRLGYEGVLCGRITSLNHRVDVPSVHEWITENTVSAF